LQIGRQTSNLQGFWIALEDLNCSEAWVIAPVEEAYPLGKNVMVAPPQNLIQQLLD